LSPVVLSRGEVTLRPFREDELDRLLEITAVLPVDDGVHWAPRDRESLSRKIRSSGTWTPDGRIDLAVETEGRLVGEIQARCPKNSLPPGAFELGVELFDEASRGRGIGTRAVGLMTALLFDEEGAHRVQLSTDVDNAAMRRTAERLGFAFEGVLRKFMPTSEGLRDYAMYAMTRDDFEDAKRTWI
jgi:ribosomal-protein-alanine N-acetyltransferase